MRDFIVIALLLFIALLGLSIAGSLANISGFYTAWAKDQNLVINEPVEKKSAGDQSGA